jgi:hypothetical protein
MNAGKIPVITVLLSLLSFSILSDSALAKYSGGSGTAGDPYKIGTPADLLTLAADTNDYGKHFILAADINLASAGTFTTAVIAPDTSNLGGGFQGVAFTGVFDGNNHTISNLTIDTGGAGNDYLGLFGGASSGEIKNLGLENVSVTGGPNSIYLGGLAGYNTDSISVCYSTGSVTGGSNSFDLGGLVGINLGNISNCHSTGAVIGGNSSVYLGGLVGDNYGSTSNCYSTGTVTGGDISYSLGGLVGRNNGGTTSKCYSTGAVSGGVGSSVLGGLVGFNYSNISDCYSTSAVTGTYYPGGLVGYNQNGSISNSYSTGDVSGTSTFGGLVGYNTSGTISNCYFLNTEPNNGLGTALTDAQMKQQSSFIGWDFVNTWCIREGVSFPKLPYQIGTASDLLAMAANTGDYDAYFVLTADINLAATGPFTTAVIAPDTNPSDMSFQGDAFTGVFDGSGHTISNLTINTGAVTKDHLGLFGQIGSGGRIKNLGLKNVSIIANSGSYYFGGLAGHNNGSNINNCYSSGIVTGGDSSGCLGGLVGYNDSGTISDCCSTATVTGGDGSVYLGGLAGSNGGTISDCYSSGAVNSEDSSQYFGGLVGHNHGNISNCYATGTVRGGGSSNYLGGLAGWNVGGSNIGNCHSSGTVSSGASSNHLGGLAGDNDGNISNCYSSGAVNSGDSSNDLGGLVGLGGGTISNSYSTSDVNGGDSSQYLGGLIAKNWGGGATINKCYSTGTIKGGASSQYLGGLIGFDNAGGVNNCYSTGDVNSGNSSQYIGGMMGENFNATISNCYSTGDVNSGSGSTNVGGLAGTNSGGTISHCYFLAGSGPDNGNGTSLTDPNMKKQSSFPVWDFDDIWRIRENAGYPKLHISNYSGGSGTAGEPYLIGTVSDLLAMAANTGDYDAYFILTADIDLAEAGPFTTAVIAPDTNNSNYSFEGTAFTGVFDGNGHTISNLTIDTNGVGNDYLGLFGEIGSGGEIKNLGLENISITGGDNSYYLGGLGGKNGGTISNCYSMGAVTGGNSSDALGGLAGENDSNISDSYSTGAIMGGAGLYGLGGLVGVNDGNGNISNCHSTGAVSGGNNSWNLGGLVGYNPHGNIGDCYSTGTVSTGINSPNVGGLVGYNVDGNISNCYSTGAVTGGNSSYAHGGLAGSNNGTIINCYSRGAVRGGNSSDALGGLVGYNGSGTNISNCYSTGNISSGASSTHIGGLTGDNGGTISSCYFLITSGPDNSAGDPLTSAKMKQQASFVGWDFIGETVNGPNEIWWINKGVDYPKLYWQLDVTKCTVTAGSKANKDKISFSGTFDAATVDFNNPGNIKVTIYSDDIVKPCDQNFPIDGTTFKRGKYNYSKTVNGVRKSFTYDVKTRKFAFSASDVNLSGLYCPATAKIDINDCNRISPLDEPIVNGSRVPIPIKLMTGVKNVLRVDKCTVKHGNKPNSDQLSVKGEFAVEDTDVNMVNEEFVATLDAQTFTLPAGSFKAGKGKFTCSKANVTEIGGGNATGEFNFNLCSFILTIKNTNIPAISGDVDFGVAFAGFNEVDQVTFP